MPNRPSDGPTEMCAPGQCNFRPSPGPEPEFLPNRQMWFGERAYVRCIHCGARTWLNRREWESARKANRSTYRD